MSRCQSKTFYLDVPCPNVAKDEFQGVPMCSVHRRIWLQRWQPGTDVRRADPSPASQTGRRPAHMIVRPVAEPSSHGAASYPSTGGPSRYQPTYPDTKAMCVRCCALRNLRHVLRLAVPLAKVPARYIYLCPPCLAVYEGFKIVEKVSNLKHAA